MKNREDKPSAFYSLISIMIALMSLPTTMIYLHFLNPPEDFFGYKAVHQALMLLLALLGIGLISAFISYLKGEKRIIITYTGFALNISGILIVLTYLL